MQKQSRAQKITQWLTHFIELQLFLSLISLPLLIAWGLPVSLLTPMANLIFNPVLTAFLFVSSLLFFTELVGVPNGLLVWALNVITKWWIWVLDWYHHSWLIGFVKPPLWFLILIPGLSLCIIASKKFYSSRVTIIAMSLLFMVICLTLYLQSRVASGVMRVAYNNDELPILHYAQKTVVIDTGIMGKRASAVSWVNYTLIPELIKRTGRLAIDHLIVMQPSIRTFEALVALSEKVQIHNLYLPLWTGTMPRGIWRHYFKLCERVKNDGGALIRIGKYTKKINLSSGFVVNIHPLDAQLKYSEASFSALFVDGSIDKKDFAFYSAKYNPSSRKCASSLRMKASNFAEASMDRSTDMMTRSKDDKNIMAKSRRSETKTERRKGEEHEEKSIVNSSARRLSAS